MLYLSSHRAPGCSKITEAVPLYVAQNILVHIAGLPAGRRMYQSRLWDSSDELDKARRANPCGSQEVFPSHITFTSTYQGGYIRRIEGNPETIGD